MIAQRTLALISYNDSNKDTSNRDYALANRLANYLRQNGVDAEIKGYSSIGSLNANSHQWLILIPSLGMEASPLMAKTVDAVLDQVVKRRMKGILAVTTGSDLPTKWITIRKYDASEPKEEDNVLQGVLRAMQFAKIPYTEAKALVQSQQAQQAAAAQQQKAAQKRRTLLFASGAAILLLIIAALFGVNYYPTIFQSTPSALSLTATAQAQAHRSATNTALAKTQTPSSSPTVGPNKKQEYQSITNKPPTISGFRDNEQWSELADGTCAFDAQNPPMYHAVTQVNNQYTPCMEAKTKLTDFALQVTMNIQGDAGGVIFRDNGSGTYYRFALNQSDPKNLTYSVYLCNNGTCDTNVVGSGNKLIVDAVPSRVNSTKPITLTVIAQGSNIDLYINALFLTSISDSTSLSGRIGVFSADLGNNTDVAFSNLRVWILNTATPAKQNNNNRRPNNR